MAIFIAYSLYSSSTLIKAFSCLICSNSAFIDADEVSYASNLAFNSLVDDTPNSFSNSVFAKIVKDAKVTFGAREIIRIVDSKIKDKFVDLVLFNEDSISKVTVTMDKENKEFEFETE